MGFNSTWAMAVGGMVGGGIFTVLGVIIVLAGGLAWLSFLLAGIVALRTGYSHVLIRLGRCFRKQASDLGDHLLRFIGTQRLQRLLECPQVRIHLV